MSGFTVIWVLVAAAIAGAGSWLVTPKGPNQVLIRTSAILTLTCCYLMWTIVYLAQLHPLISPKRADVRFLEE
ncbi:related to vacuolar atp synthase subunit h [Ceraceosorus bombacis]|uniref:Related to vacuolar atp synthase subunit h n=2 Tax=Ceraceosorus TaxID=401624 RepID=A0A0P1BIR0_9BASI|nr:hypothetical protein IE81DRAFT_323685 [Ceraceosorus guamensis]PWN42198.1 hypothetical protein IE81DRAFT_323685 [Ceraceosorus guamensis]CEH15609.1 related to vacuolar atp synthase subunit h [Ceraceosorus bombacis]